MLLLLVLGVPGLLSGCNDSPFDPTAEAHLNGRAETGVMNTLYALNQLSGDFFTRATRFRYVDMTQAEMASLNGVLAADAEHARWYVETVRSGRIFDYLTFDFSSVEFSDQRRAQRATAIRNAEKPSTARNPTKAG